MPGSVCRGRERRQGVAYLPGRTRRAGEFRHLAVTGNCPGRNPSNDRVDNFVAHGKQPALGETTDGRLGFQSESSGYRLGLPKHTQSIAVGEPRDVGLCPPASD